MQNRDGLAPPFKWGDTDNKNVKNRYIRRLHVEIKCYGENKTENRTEIWLGH